MGVLLVFCQNASATTDYSALELKQLIDSEQPVFLLNPLSEIEFNEAHIPGSVNIPAETIMWTNELPKDKDMLIVTYCKGPK
jgi:rhodanese-related sulfurtransferase